MRPTGKNILVILALVMMIPGAAWCCCSFASQENPSASNDQACCNTQSQSHDSDPAESDCPDSPTSDQPGGCPVRVSISDTIPLLISADRVASPGAFAFNALPCLPGQHALVGQESEFKLAYLYEHPPEKTRCRSLLSLHCLATT